MLRLDTEIGFLLDDRFAFWWLMAPRPCVAEPKMWNNVEWSWLWTSVPCCYSEEQLLVVICIFGYLNKYVPVTIIPKLDISILEL